MIFPLSKEKDKFANDQGVKFILSSEEIETTFSKERLSFIEYDFKNSRVFVAYVNAKIINIFEMAYEYDSDNILISVSLKKNNILLSSHSNAKYIHFMEKYLMLETLSEIILFDRISYIYYDNFGISLKLDMITEVIIVERLFIDCFILTSKKFMIVAVILETENEIKNIFK